MISELRRKRLQELFDFYDVDKSGTIDKRGFEMDINMITKARGFKVGDDNHKRVQDTLLDIWDSILKDGDSDNDGKVTFDEWVSMWNKFGKNPYEWQNLFCEFIFFVFDVKDDGVIDLQEFISVNDGFGINKDTTLAAFKKISRGKESISFPEYQELWKDYFSSDDPNAIGVSIFSTNL